MGSSIQVGSTLSASENDDCEVRPTDRRGRPVRDLRVSVIDACNLRCSYCMPEDEASAPLRFLKRRQLLSVSEIRRMVQTFAELGVEKVRITGGEPLMRDDLPEIIAAVAEIDGITDVAMTTNGYWLGKHADRLHAAGLKRLTVSLDTLSPDRARDLSGRPLEPQRILDGIEAASAAGFEQIKINTVVIKGKNDDEVLAMAEAFRHTGRILRFIEYMDVGTRNNWQSDDVAVMEDVLARIAAVYALDPVDPRWQGEVAKRYCYRDGGGEIGFITSVSQPFCHSCNRARITADGRLYTCLFANEGLSIRHLLGEGDRAQLRDKLRRIWQLRDDNYSEVRHQVRQGNHRPVEMNHVGG